MILATVVWQAIALLVIPIVLGVIVPAIVREAMRGIR